MPEAVRMMTVVLLSSTEQNEGTCPTGHTPANGNHLPGPEDTLVTDTLLQKDEAERQK